MMNLNANQDENSKARESDRSIGYVVFVIPI